MPIYGGCNPSSVRTANLKTKKGAGRFPPLSLDRSDQWPKVTPRYFVPGMSSAARVNSEMNVSISMFSFNKSQLPSP